MAVIGVDLGVDQLVLTTGRDFRWMFVNLDGEDQPIDFPDGDLYFELGFGDSITTWTFDIDGDTASLKIESPAADLIANRTQWQLVFLANGEAAGGDPIARGTVKRQP